MVSPYFIIFVSNKNKNTIMETIKTSETKGLKEFYGMNDLVKLLSKSPIIWSWGANSWVAMNDFYLRFKVQAHRHKGHIYICVNASDLFDVYLTSTKGTIKKVFRDVYVKDLVTTIDNEIEKINIYYY